MCRIFWKQSSLACKTSNQLTASPKPTTCDRTELHSSGTAFLPIPCPGNTCLASRPALEDSEETKGTPTQSTHMELWAPVIRPGTSVAFWGWLCVQAIRPRPAVPFSFFTLYAPIASTTTFFSNNDLSDGSPKEEVFCCCLFFGRWEWKRNDGTVEEKGLFLVYPMRHLSVSRWAFAISEERFALTFIFWICKLQTLVPKMQPSIVNLAAQESLLLYRKLCYSGPNFPVSDPDVIQGN